MRIIPVIDLSRGVAVHARAGDRARYQPVRSALAPRSLGDPRALLQGYRERLGARECYLADLDAIQGETPQLGLIEELAPLAGTLLVDGAVTEPEMARALLRRWRHPGRGRTRDPARRGRPGRRRDRCGR
jgi:phosphoribosylformimino-5-aminoimidazole carboxamide ribotide isomerase